VYDHARKLAERGHDVYLVTRGMEGVPRFQIFEGIKIVRSAIAYRSSSLLKRLSLILEQIITIMILQRTLRFEVIHVHGYTAGLSAIPAKLSFGVPLVITTHGTELLWPKEVRWKNDAEIRLTLLFERFVLNFCNIIVVQSAGVYDYMLKIYGTNIWQKARLIHTGVDHLKFSYSMPSQGNRVLFVGTLSEIKGVSKLINAFATVHREIAESELILAGAGPNRERYEKLTKSLHLDGSVTFLGSIRDDQRLKELYANSDIVVLPSLVGGPVSCTILEGLSSGRAVISTNVVGGIPDVLKGVGVLLPVLDTKILSDEIINMLKDRNRLRVIQKKSRETIERNYTLDSMIDKLEQLYSSIRN
jgi:glycosyltransferase involved in cell wall biosynthesis